MPNVRSGSRTTDVSAAAAPVPALVPARDDSDAAAGLQYLARLVRHPGQAWPAAELALIAGETDADTASDAAERARVNVSRAIKSTLDWIVTAHPELGDHLRRSVRTGGACVYDPDPRAAVVWTS